MAKVIDAILAINPNAKVVTRGSTIDSIEIDWLDETAEISKADIETKLTELNNNVYANDDIMIKTVLKKMD